MRRGKQDFVRPKNSYIKEEKKILINHSLLICGNKKKVECQGKKKIEIKINNHWQVFFY